MLSSLSLSRLARSSYSDGALYAASSLFPTYSCSPRFGLLNFPYSFQCFLGVVVTLLHDPLFTSLPPFFFSSLTFHNARGPRHALHQFNRPTLFPIPFFASFFTRCVVDRTSFTRHALATLHVT